MPIDHRDQVETSDLNKRSNGLENEMRSEISSPSDKDDNLVHLYQDIMQCEEDHAKSVLLLLSEVMVHQETPLPGSTSQG